MKHALNGQNGTTKTAIPEIKTAIPAPQQPKKEAATKQPTLDDRIQRIEELRALTLKRQRLIATLNQLRSFQFASDDNCVLSIADGQAQKFVTNNSNLIGLLRDYFTTLLNDKISALDDEIMNFKL